MRAPFAYYGGKSAISPLIWQCLGDPRYYVEPFGGSLGNLLARPKTSHRIVNETVGDADCLIIHCWRAIRNDPNAVAWHAISPVASTELQARHTWLVAQRQRVTEELADPNWHDPKIAGWWVWGQGLVVSGDWCGRWPKLTPKLPWSEVCNRVRQMSPDQLSAYFRELAIRLRNVAIVHGDWKRTLDFGLRKVRGEIGLFFDPPYSGRTGRKEDLYAIDSLTVADDVADWCRYHGNNKRYKIAICGFEGEHDLPGWRCFAWQNLGGKKKRRDRERIWFSPHCLNPTKSKSA